MYINIRDLGLWCTNLVLVTNVIAIFQFIYTAILHFICHITSQLLIYGRSPYPMYETTSIKAFGTNVTNTYWTFQWCITFMYFIRSVTRKCKRCPFSSFFHDLSLLRRKSESRFQYIELNCYYWRITSAYIQNNSSSYTSATKELRSNLLHQRLAWERFKKKGMRRLVNFKTISPIIYQILKFYCNLVELKV